MKEVITFGDDNTLSTNFNVKGGARAWHSKRILSRYADFSVQGRAKLPQIFFFKYPF